jgi:mono/diheme cytochrome c family protein
MSSTRACAACLVGVFLLLLAAPSARAQTGYVGSELYKTYCSSCHGANGKGDGPLAANLRVRPADLTLIAKRMGGTFATDKVQRMIDGRDPVKGHGGADMPVWGDAFKSSREGYSEQAVKARIEALTEHLANIQEKPAK